MSDIDLDKLETIAKAATPGPWNAHGSFIDADNYREVIAPGDVSCMSHCLGGSSRITGDNLDADLQYIASMNPETALALIRELRATRMALAANALFGEYERRERHERQTRRDQESELELRKAWGIVEAWHSDDEELRIPDSEWGSSLYHAVERLLDETRGVKG